LNPSEELKTQFGLTSIPSAFFVAHFDNSVRDIYNEKDFETFEQWIAYYRYPVLTEISKQNSVELIRAGIPVVFLFADSEEMRAEYTPMLKELAMETRTKLLFVFIDWVKYGTQAAKLGVKKN